MKFIFPLFLYCLFSFSSAFAISEAAVLFLLLEPSPSSAGMGHASIASFEHGPMDIIMNPAHVAFAGENRRIGAESYIFKRNLFDVDDVYIKTHAFTLGRNIKNTKNLNINLGLSYSRIYANYGKQIITGEEGPEPIGILNSNESADIFSLGLNLNWWMKAAIGISTKFIDSNLPNVGAGSVGRDGDGKATAWDIGVYAEAPILKSQQTKDGTFSHYLNTSFAFVKANSGDEISYIDASQADPLPRVSRMGLGVKGGLTKHVGDKEFDILTLELLAEAQDLLVKRNNTEISYDTYGHINPVTHLILGRSDKEVITKRGLSVEFAELLSLNLGYYDDGDRNFSYGTWGIAIKLQGLFNIRALYGYDESENSIIQFIQNNVDLEYYYSKVDEDSFANPTYHGLRVRLF